MIDRETPRSCGQLLATRYLEAWMIYGLLPLMLDGRLDDHRRARLARPWPKFLPHKSPISASLVVPIFFLPALKSVDDHLGGRL